MGNRPRAFQRAIDGLRTLPLSPCGVFLLMGWVGTHLPKFNRSSQARQRTSRFVVWRGAGRSARHHGLNDVTWRALSAANIPAAKEPSGLLRSDGKRPDGLTLIPWKNGRCATCDVTVTDTLAQSYLPVTAGTSGAAAEAAAERKTLKYVQLSQTYTFIPVAVETMGPMNSAGLEFVSDTGRRITQVSIDNRESAFLFQRLSILIQRFNSVATRGTFATDIQHSVAVVQPSKSRLHSGAERTQSSSVNAGCDEWLVRDSCTPLPCDVTWLERQTTVQHHAENVHFLHLRQTLTTSA